MSDALDRNYEAAVAAGWVTEFEGQRPPYMPGNKVSVGNLAKMKHGARSPRRVDPVAADLVAVLLADDAVQYLRAPRFAAAVQAWAQAEAKCALIAEWVDGMAVERAAESKQGQTSPLELLRKWEATAQTHRGRLGLDPLSAARLGKDVASARVDIAQLLTASRESGTTTSQEGTEHDD